MDQEAVKAFLYRIFGEPAQRRAILLHWHAMRSQAKSVERLADVFANFLRTVLYGPLQFRLQMDRFYLFQGNEWPVMIEWIAATEANRALLRSLVAHRARAFKSSREFQNGEFEHAGLAMVSEAAVVDGVWRRQLARDFVYMVVQRAPGALMELVVALQTLLQEQRSRGDLFVSNMHQALQGVCDPYRVLAIH
jgi:hypothetical protein